MGDRSADTSAKKVRGWKVGSERMLRVVPHRDLQVKTTRHYSASADMAKAPNTASAGCRPGRAAAGAGGNAEPAATLEDSSVACYKTKPTLTVRPNNHTPWHSHKGSETLCPHKNLQTDV